MRNRGHRLALSAVATVLISGVLGTAPEGVRGVDDCRCLVNGGKPGPDDCPCDVAECYFRCVDVLCPDTPNCTIECSARCRCNSAPSRCPNHVDPGSTPTPIGTRTPDRVCVGDCNADGSVRVDEVVLGVTIALNFAPLGYCQVCDANRDGHVTVDDLVQAVANAMNGCR